MTKGNSQLQESASLTSSYTVDDNVFEKNVQKLKNILFTSEEKTIRRVLQLSFGDIEIALNSILHDQEVRETPKTEISDRGESSEQSWTEGKKFIQDVGEEITCPICCMLFTDPVCLPNCRHIYCRECVEHLALYTPECPCPVCRTLAFPMARSKDVKQNLESLQTERTIASISEHFKSLDIDFHTLHAQKLKKKEKTHSAVAVTYSVTLKEAKAAFDTWIKGLWFVPSSFRNGAKIKDLQPVWIPFYIFSSHIPQRVGLSQRWKREVFTSPGGFFPEKSLSPEFQFEHLEHEPFLKEHRKQANVREFSVSPEDAWSRVKRNVVQRLEQTKVPFDEKRIILSHSEKLYFPCYVGSYSFQGTSYKIIVSGVTGEVSAERPSLFSSFL